MGGQLSSSLCMDSARLKKKEVNEKNNSNKQTNHIRKGSNPIEIPIGTPNHKSNDYPHQTTKDRSIDQQLIGESMKHDIVQSILDQNFTQKQSQVIQNDLGASSNSLPKNHIRGNHGLHKRYSQKKVDTIMDVGQHQDQQQSDLQQQYQFQSLEGIPVSCLEEAPTFIKEQKQGENHIQYQIQSKNTTIINQKLPIISQKYSNTLQNGVLSPNTNNGSLKLYTNRSVKEQQGSMIDTKIVINNTSKPVSTHRQEYQLNAFTSLGALPSGISNVRTIPSTINPNHDGSLFVPNVPNVPNLPNLPNLPQQPTLPLIQSSQYGQGGLDFDAFGSISPSQLPTDRSISSIKVKINHEVIVDNILLASKYETNFNYGMAHKHKNKKSQNGRKQRDQSVQPEDNQFINQHNIKKQQSETLKKG